MPSFTNCEKDKDGNTYCYDNESGEVMRVRLEKVAIKSVPREVLLKLLQKGSGYLKR